MRRSERVRVRVRVRSHVRRPPIKRRRCAIASQRHNGRRRSDLATLTDPPPDPVAVDASKLHNERVDDRQEGRCGEGRCGERDGVCVCGRLLRRHFDLGNRMRGCGFAIAAEYESCAVAAAVIDHYVR